MEQLKTKPRSRKRATKISAANAHEASRAGRIAEANELVKLLGDERVISDSADREALFKVYRKARLLFEELVAEDPRDAYWEYVVGVTYYRIGGMLAEAGDRTGALAEWRKCMEIAERLAAKDLEQSSHDGICSLKFSTHDRIGGMLAANGDRDGALAEYREGLEIAERLAAYDLGNVVWQGNLAISHQRIGSILSANGDRDGALAEYHKGLEIVERLAANDPGNANWQHHLGVSRDEIGNILAAGGDRTGALAKYREGQEIAEKLAASDRGNIDWQRELVISHGRIGGMLAAAGDFTSALAEYRKGSEIAERLVANDPGNAEWQGDLAPIRGKIGDMLAAAGNRTGALAEYWRALEIAERLAGDDPGNVRWESIIAKLVDNIDRIDKSKTTDYTRGQLGVLVGDAEEISEDDLIALVRKIPVERRLAARDLLQEFAAAKDVTTGRAVEEPGRPETTATETRAPQAPARAALSQPGLDHAAEEALAAQLAAIEQEARKRVDGTLLELVHRYAELRKSTELPVDGLKTLDQARSAALLSTTFGNLQARLEKYDLEPLPRDPRVVEARRQSSSFYRRERVKKPSGRALATAAPA